MEGSGVSVREREDKDSDEMSPFMHFRLAGIYFMYSLQHLLFLQYRLGNAECYPIG